jgi:hypothetical protein
MTPSPKAPIEKPLTPKQIARAEANASKQRRKNFRRFAPLAATALLVLGVAAYCLLPSKKDAADAVRASVKPTQTTEETSSSVNLPPQSDIANINTQTLRPIVQKGIAAAFSARKSPLLLDSYEAARDSINAAGIVTPPELFGERKISLQNFGSTLPTAKQPERTFVFPFPTPVEQGHTMVVSPDGRLLALKQFLNALRADGAEPNWEFNRSDMIFLTAGLDASKDTLYSTYLTEGSFKRINGVCGEAAVRNAAMLLTLGYDPFIAINAAAINYGKSNGADKMVPLLPLHAVVVCKGQHAGDKVFVFDPLWNGIHTVSAFLSDSSAQFQWQRDSTSARCRDSGAVGGRSRLFLLPQPSELPPEFLKLILSGQPPSAFGNLPGGQFWFMSARRLAALDFLKKTGDMDHTLMQMGYVERDIPCGN